MTEQLPVFRYHPDPLATGVVKNSNVTCVCCRKARGLIYIGPVYSRNELDGSLCPWCIADGSAAAKLDVSFADPNLLIIAGVPKPVVEEVHLRTPGFFSWQQEHWLSHCNDACEFHGDASVDDILAASQETKQHWMTEYRQDEAAWEWVTNNSNCKRF